MIRRGEVLGRPRGEFGQDGSSSPNTCGNEHVVAEVQAIGKAGQGRAGQGRAGQGSTRRGDDPRASSQRVRPVVKTLCRQCILCLAHRPAIRKEYVYEETAFSCVQHNLDLVPSRAILLIDGTGNSRPVGRGGRLTFQTTDDSLGTTASGGTHVPGSPTHAPTQ